MLRRSFVAAGGLAVLVISGHLVSCSDSGASRPTLGTTTNAKASLSSPERQIPYRILKEWAIPNGGYGRVILIDPIYRNESDMRILGDNLQYNTRDDRNAFIEVYDNAKAASVRDEAFAERLSKKDLAHHDKHLIGRYVRNGNTGAHQLQIMLNGIEGKWIEVKY